MRNASLWTVILPVALFVAVAYGTVAVAGVALLAGGVGGWKARGALVRGAIR